MPGEGSQRGPNILTANESAHGVFLAWERLRIPYNAATVRTLLAYGAQLHQLSESWFPKFCIIFGFLTNVAFCVGPCAEGYLSWLGMDRRANRILLFIAGTLLACFRCFVLLTEKELHPDAPHFALH